MTAKQSKKHAARPQRIALTARLSLHAYEQLVAIQQRHRRRTGRALPLWRILDAAIIAYADNHDSPAA